MNKLFQKKKQKNLKVKSWKKFKNWSKKENKEERSKMK